VKNAAVLFLTFAVGVASGVLVHRSLAKSQPTQPSTTQSPTAYPPTSQQWTETEEQTRKRMKDFQDRLDKLQPPPNSDSVERIAKEMELQRGIDDILTKYREAQQSKFTLLSVAGASVIAALLSILGTWFSLRGRKSSHDTGKAKSVGVS